MDPYKTFLALASINESLSGPSSRCDERVIKMIPISYLKLILLLTQVETLVLVVANVTCINTERRALLEFKHNLIDNYGCLSSWDTQNEDANCCNWSGVQCNRQTGHVEKLILYGDINYQQPLRGMISSSLLELKHLKYLDLRWNDFMGTSIPEFFGFLSTLEYLSAGSALFGGKIPYQLGLLSHLYYLDLSGNHLEGVVPQQLGNLSNLEELYLGFNHYLIIDNAEWLSNLSSLVSLDISGVSNLNASSNWLQMVAKNPLTYLILENCSLSDTDLLSVPLSKLNFSTSLRYLNLRSNKFTSLIFPCLFNFNASLALLYLGNNFLQGPIPYNLGSSMSSLALLGLKDNQLNGTIPQSIGSLSNLETLYLDNNPLKGVITESFFANLTKFRIFSSSSLTLNFSNTWVPPFQLLYLALGSCKLGRSFPNWLRTQNNLLFLDISSSGISDAIPEFLFCNHNATALSLTKLNMSNNKLSGQLPNCWSLFKHLLVVDLSNNLLSGKIPTSIGSLVQIHQLILRNNNFVGEFPSMKNCTELKLLDLGENKLSGPIPSWIGDRLQKLEILSLRENQFSGNLPLHLCHLRSIQVLDLSMNKLFGEIPKCIKNFSAMARKVNIRASMIEVFVYSMKDDLQSDVLYDLYPLVMWKGKEVRFKDYKRLLKIIDLSSNQLSGKVPIEIGYLAELVSFNLSRNNLSGEIPATLGNLHSLDFLDLSRNHFGGIIPWSLSKIDRLSVLDLSNNNLSGKIPIGTQLQSFNASVYDGNTYLCGRPLERLCPDEKESKSPSTFEEHEEEQDNPYFTQGFYISMGLGFTTGFWAIFGSLLLFRSWRHTYFTCLNDIFERIIVTVIIYAAKSRKLFDK